MILTYSECVFFLIYSHGKKYTKSMVENKISKNRSICEDGVNLAECASDVPIFLTLKVFACGIDFLACPWHILLAYSLRDTLNYLYNLPQQRNSIMQYYFSFKCNYETQEIGVLWDLNLFILFCIISDKIYSLANKSIFIFILCCDPFVSLYQSNRT